MKHLDYWNEAFFNVFPDLAFVRGDNDASIYDFKRNALLPIPLVLCDIVEQLEDESCGAIISSLDKESKSYFVQYLNYLHKNDLGAFRNKKLNFKAIQPTWDFPATIISFQLNLSSKSNFDPFCAIDQIVDQHCHQLELRLKNEWGHPAKVEAILEAVATSGIRGIHLYVAHGEKWCASSVNNLFKSYPKLLFFNACNVENKYNENLHPGAIRLSDEKWTEKLWAINHFQDRYIVNIDYFHEAQEFHPLLNRRVCLDENGFWKNDLYYKQNHGHISDIALGELISLESFTKWWRINPDKIVDLKASSRRYAVLPIKPLIPLNNGSGLYTFEQLYS